MDPSAPTQETSTVISTVHGAHPAADDADMFLMVLCFESLLSDLRGTWHAAFVPPFAKALKDYEAKRSEVLSEHAWLESIHNNLAGCEDSLARKRTFKNAMMQPAFIWFLLYVFRSSLVQHLSPLAREETERRGVSKLGTPLCNPVRALFEIICMGTRSRTFCSSTASLPRVNGFSGLDKHAEDMGRQLLCLLDPEATRSFFNPTGCLSPRACLRRYCVLAQLDEAPFVKPPKKRKPKEPEPEHAPATPPSPHLSSEEEMPLLPEPPPLPTEPEIPMQEEQQQPPQKKTRHRNADARTVAEALSFVCA